MGHWQELGNMEAKKIRRRQSKQREMAGGGGGGGGRIKPIEMGELRCYGFGVKVEIESTYDAQSAVLSAQLLAFMLGSTRSLHLILLFSA